MKPTKKAIIFAPFWRMPGHVGSNRVERFVRWLAADGYEVVMIRAGAREGEWSEPWGREIAVVDRLGLHPDPQPGRVATAPTRKPNKLRRALAYWLFNPDPAVVWARAAARNPKVRAEMTGAAFILSSSPPESAHVGAWKLSRAHGVPHIMDMRDGWLDEPLKPLLLNSALRRWQERRLESAVAHNAAVIFVTSGVWKELFDARYPQLAQRVHVLTNAYPASLPESKQVQRKQPADERVLIHSGRFTGSRLTQSPELLLEPLLRHLAVHPSKGVIRLYGDLSADERTLIDSFRERYGKIGWRIEAPGSLPRAQLLEEMQEADGFLLLSASHAPLPSKAFEYISLRKPIFAVVGEKSATSDLCSRLPQCLAVNVGRADTVERDELFYMRRDAEVPRTYGEEYLHALFLDKVNSLSKGARCP